MVKIYDLVRQLIFKLYFLEKQNVKLTYNELEYIHDYLENARQCVSGGIEPTEAETKIKAVKIKDEFIEDANTPKIMINVQMLDKLQKAINIDAQVLLMEDVKELGSGRLQSDAEGELFRYINYIEELMLSEEKNLKYTEDEKLEWGK